MRRFTHTIVTILLCGSMFLSTGISSNAMPNYNNPVTHTPMYGGLSFHYHIQTNVLNTFNNLFPIYSYQRKVCRKPFSNNLFLKDNSNNFFSTGSYEFQEFTYKTTPIGSHFLKISGSSIYKSGNSLLLIPHSYFVPTMPSLGTEMPHVLVPSAN